MQYLQEESPLALALTDEKAFTFTVHTLSQNSSHMPERLFC